MSCSPKNKYKISLMKLKNPLSKRLTLIAKGLLIIYQFGYSQGNVYKEEVVFTSDTMITKDILFEKANEWVALKFTSANDVIQMMDKEAGKIIVKGMLPVKLYKGVLSFALIIECKDKRYKYSIIDVIHKYPDSGKIWGGDILNEDSPAIPMTLFKGQWEKVRTNGDISINELLADLKTHMEKAFQNSNW